MNEFGHSFSKPETLEAGDSSQNLFCFDTRSFRMTSTGSKLFIFPKCLP